MNFLFFCLAAMAFQVVIFLIERHGDKTAVPNFIPDDGATEDALKEVPSLLERYGEVARNGVPELLKSVDANLLKDLARYSKVEFDWYFTPVDLSLATAPCELNEDYVKIGTWSGDIDFLVKREGDGNIYAIDNDECSDPGAPS